ncbi:MAG: dihydropteroate synthase [Acidobacteriota bacterium]|nr:dihydropteroate synthase [Acidobacteriota bacterium]
MRQRFRLQLPHGTLELGRKTLIMGILNVTPDSFYDGGAYLRTDEAIEHGLQLEDQGADLVDVGGESTRPDRPGSVSATDELRRVVPVIEQLAKRLTVPISVDTYKSEVAHSALAAGASVVNDISGLRFDPDMAACAAAAGAAMVLMHSRGSPQRLHGLPALKRPLQSVLSGLRHSVKKAHRAGIPSNRIILDPGLGFGKGVEDNLLILRRLEVLKRFQLPILVGPSRKSFIGNLLNLPVEQRLLGSLASTAVAVIQGAHIIRVHDVEETRQVVQMCDAIMGFSA